MQGYEIKRCRWVVHIAYLTDMRNKLKIEFEKNQEVASWQSDLDERMHLMEQHVRVWETDLDEAILLME